MSGGALPALPRPMRRLPLRKLCLPLLALLLVLLASIVPAGAPHAAPAGLRLRAAAAAAPAAAGDWTTFHGSADRSGYSPVNGPSQGSTIWLTCPTTVPIRAGPVGNGTRMFAADEFGHVFAFDTTRNGSLLWTQTLDAVPATPELDPPYLLVPGSDGAVHALLAASGAFAWNSSPIGGSLVQGVASDNGTLFVGSSSGAVAAIAVATGAIVWNRSTGDALGGALAVSGGSLFGATENGTVFSMTETGTLRWTHPVAGRVNSAPAVAGGTVYVGDLSGTITALAASNGTPLWTYRAGPPSTPAPINETPAVGEGRLFVQTDLGEIVALNASTGTPVWNASVVYSGYPATPSPALTPTGLYLVEETQDVADWEPATGRLLWRSQISYSTSFASPAVEGGIAYVGVDTGCIMAFGSLGGVAKYAVSGTVVDPLGNPIADAFVVAGPSSSVTGANGSFRLELSNGSYLLRAEATGREPAVLPLDVSGPISNLTVILRPLAVYLISGTVADGSSGMGIGGAVVTLEGIYGYSATTVTAPDGSFSVRGPNGSNYLAVGPPQGYTGASTHVTVRGAAVSSVEISVAPTSLSASSLDPEGVSIWLPIVAIALAASGTAYWSAVRRRVEAGLPRAVLSPFARFVAMRALLIPVQALALLTVLYAVGTVLTGVAHGVSGWTYLPGYFEFLRNLFTLQWGDAMFGNLRAPALSFLQWWAGDSIELALLAIPISAALAYPLGLLAGWRQGGAVDVGARGLSLVGLLLPTFLLILLILTALYDPFRSSFGDSAYGTLPSYAWLSGHGGVPRWIGPAGNTSPTSLPVVDGALHDDWPFVGLVLAKGLVQALAIAVVYTSIFLRYARHAVAESARETHVVAARARGVPERTILWHHLGVRVWPIYLLVIGITLPVYVGTQAIVEALSNDTGLGTLLLSEVTHISLASGFGFAGGVNAGNFYQVAIFLLLFTVLIANLASDVLARYLDPRLLRRER